MPVRCPEPEQDITRRVLAFANLRHLQSTVQVEDVFRGAALVAGMPFRTLDPMECQAYQNDQRDLRRRLADIVSGDVRRRAQVAGEVSPLLTETVRLGLVLHAGHLRLAYDAAGVGALCMLALAFILDEARGLTNRLGQCRKPKCDRFNLTFRGRPRFYCNDAHRLAFDKIDAKRRVKEHRKRKQRRSKRKEQ